LNIKRLHVGSEKGVLDISFTCFIKMEKQGFES
jgi:hypothetical protein